jgi:hypothetical protein
LPAVLAASFALFVLVAAVAAAAPQSPGFSLQWTRPAPPLKTMALSPKGLKVGLITTDGKLAVWSASDGSPLWSHNALDEDDLTVTDGAGYATAYNLLNPIQRTVRFYKAENGVEISRQTFASAIWSVAAAPSGSLVAVGTEDKTITVFEMSEQVASAMSSTSGIPTDMQYSSTGKYLVVGRWDRSGCETRDLHDNLLWQTSVKDNQRVSVVVSGTGAAFATISCNNRQNADPVVALYSRQGQLQWVRDFGKRTQDAHALVLAPAQITVVSYIQMIRRGRDVLAQRRLIAIGDSGNELWERGGPLFTPQLICATPDDSGIVIYDGSRNLYRLDAAGRVVAHDRLSGLLVNHAVSRDNSKLLLYTNDSQLSMIQVT